MPLKCVLKSQCAWLQILVLPIGQGCTVAQDGQELNGSLLTPKIPLSLGVPFRSPRHSSQHTHSCCPQNPRATICFPPLAFVLEISRSLPRQEPPPSNPVPLPATELTAGHTGLEGTCGAHPVSPPGNNRGSKSARVF